MMLDVPMTAYKRWGCVIQLHRQSYYCSDSKTVHHWTGYKFENFMRWKWYFRYRAALLQVQNPYVLVEIREYQFDIALADKEKERHLRAKLTAAKRKHTEYLNKVEQARQIWQELFPIESDPLFEKVMGKISRLKVRISELEEEIKTEYPSIIKQES